MPEDKKDSKNFGGNSKAMLAYGVIQLGSTVVSAVALAAIAFGFCSIKNEAKFYNECVEERVDKMGDMHSEAVRYCNGG